MIDQITTREQFEAIKQETDDLLLVVFYTDKSRKSLEAVRALSKLQEHNGDANIYRVNAVEVSDIHPEYDITTVPTLLVFRHGKPAEYIYGVQTEGFYSKILDKFHAAANGDIEEGSAHQVTVYTTPTCPYCTQVKRYLDEHNVRYSEVDVASNPAAAQELVQRTGQQGVPQTEIDGQFVIGYNTAEIDRLLNL
ncbi:MAG: thioredoxin family protein [Candidatus Marinimicrobia bacterium]|nr:thioredoxin family protein [Candidatus Neomarinimicrobiota bacterium]MCF7827897.1 thioredoxin family protein [Candidatus Neomarinimicrobiota bacterium]MCF7879348.1 thioredoxin family protein [Candidatus Neomarinimicrobiota bacterium]